MHHFPPPPQADLSDMIDFEYPDPVSIPAELTQEEVFRVIRKSKKDNALGPDRILNRILQLLIYN